MNKKILLLLGDICDRLGNYSSIINEFDEVIIAPNKAMLSRSKTNCIKIPKHELMDIELEENDLRRALIIISDITNKLKHATGGFDDYAWKYRANHFSINLRENALSIVALEKFISNNIYNKIYMLVESMDYITCDYWRQFTNEESNILQHYLRASAEKNKWVINDVKIKRLFNFYGARMALKDFYYPKIIKLVRLRFLIISIFKQRIKKIQSPARTDKPTMLFYSRSRVHYKSYKRIMEECSAKYNIVLLSHEFDEFYESLSTSVEYRILSEFFKLKYFWDIFKKNVNTENNVKNDFWGKYLNEYLKRIYSLSGYGLMYRKTLNNAIVNIRPKFIVASDEPGGHMQEIYSLAKRHSIPTIRVQHGELSEAEVIAFHTNITSNLCIVQIGGAKNLLKKHNCGEINVQEFQFNYGNLVNAEGNKFNIKPSRDMVLICGTSLGEACSLDIVVNIYDKISSTLIDYDLVYRPHPSESIDFFIKEFRKRKIAIKVEDPNKPFESKLSNLRLCIVILSSIGHEMAIRGVPVFYYSFNRWLGASYNDKAFKIFRDLNVLCENVRKFAQDSHFRSSVQNNAMDYMERCSSISESQMIEFYENINNF